MREPQFVLAPAFANELDQRPTRQARAPQLASAHSRAERYAKSNEMSAHGRQAVTRHDGAHLKLNLMIGLCMR